MTGPNRALLSLALLLLASLALRAQGPNTPQAASPAAPVQPLPYSHKTHLALGLDCRGCHVNPGDGKLMTYPPTAFCMACHRTVAADRPPIQKLAAFAASDAPVPWVRVYKLPDYVYWKHAPHLQAGVTCVECHGPVNERDVIAQETNVVTMVGCLACHNKRQVYTDCGDCHAPRQ
jgi:Cytochrome c7 and related cytochrome c